MGFIQCPRVIYTEPTDGRNHKPDDIFSPHLIPFADGAVATAATDAVANVGASDLYEPEENWKQVNHPKPQ